MTARSSTPLMDDSNDAERQPLQAQRKDMLGTLASGMAHELRNIVMPVLLRLDVLTASQELPSSALNDLESIRKSMRHLQHLAEGLRLLSPDASLQPAERPVARLHSWWADFRPVVVGTLPAHADVYGEFPETLPLAAIPQSVLAQSVMSLLLDATPSAMSVANPTVRLQVIEEAEYLRLTLVKNFQKLDAVPRMGSSHSSNSMQPETSMRFGLSASRELLRRYGGDLSREIDDDQVRVTITLPRVTRAETRQRRIRVDVHDPRVLAVVRLLMQQRGVDTVRDSDTAPVDLHICDEGTLPSALRAADTSQTMEIVVLGVQTDHAPVPVGVRWADVNDVGALVAVFG